MNKVSKVCIKKVTNMPINRVIYDIFKKIDVIDWIKNSKKVLIKPNFACSISTEKGVTTDLRIITNIIKILNVIGIDDIIVGESSIMETHKVFQDLGIYELEKLGAKVVNFDNDRWVTVESTTKLLLDKFKIPKSVFTSDLIIDVPKMKTHGSTMLTLGLKNFFGILKSSERAKYHFLGLDNAIVDVFSYLVMNKKIISIVDAIHALEGPFGPTKGRVVDMNLIIGGNDVVATDYVCSILMGCNPKKVRHLAISKRLKLGNDIKNTELFGEHPKNLIRKFNLPSYHLSYFYRYIKRMPYVRPERCNLCRRCVQVCPKNAITISRKFNHHNKQIKFDYSKCFSCLTCCEVCNYGALDYKLTFPFSLIQRTLRHDI